jgi:GTP-binding protein
MLRVMTKQTDNPARNQLYRRAKFLISAAASKQFPADDGIEVAFAGRSNAGKSSAINRLCDNRGLAKTSKTPGRTRLVNFFALDEKRRLVDLPGYGYAKVPEQMKLEWEKLMQQYLNQPTLAGLVVIMDIRHPLREFDLHMLSWCAHFNLPGHVLLTKADKLKRGPAQATLLKVKKQLEQDGCNASVQIFSALKGTGLNELCDRLNTWFQV